MDKNEKIKNIANAVAKLEKDYGKGSIMKMSDKPESGIDCFSSGSLSLDIALGIGGFPKGRIVEIYGPESSGKTTIALHAIAEVQKEGGTAVMIDAEHAFDPNYAEALGIDLKELYICQPDNGEQGLETVDTMCTSGVDLIVVDSVAALTPKAEIEGEMGDSKMGLQARLMSQALRKIVGKVSKHNCTVIFINQLREKIGVMFGSPETTTGGNALKFYASVRLDVRRVGQNKDNEGTVTANKTRVKVVKNKVAPPFKIAEFDIEFGIGIVRESEVLDMAVEREVVKKSGSWFSYGETKLGQGRDAVIQLLRDNPELTQEIDQELQVIYGLIEV